MREVLNSIHSFLYTRNRNKQERKEWTDCVCYTIVFQNFWILLAQLLSTKAHTWTALFLTVASMFQFPVTELQIIPAFKNLIWKVIFFPLSFIQIQIQIL